MGSINDIILGKYVSLQKNLMNEKRIKILLLLNEKQRGWSQLMADLDIRNPKLLYDHLTALSSWQLIKKSDSGPYQITKNGTTLLESNMRQMQKISSILKEMK